MQDGHEPFKKGLWLLNPAHLGGSGNSNVPSKYGLRDRSKFKSSVAQALALGTSQTEWFPVKGANQTWGENIHVEE